jgi:hypothetical protein
MKSVDRASLAANLRAKGFKVTLAVE